MRWTLAAPGSDRNFIKFFPRKGNYSEANV